MARYPYQVTAAHFPTGTIRISEPVPLDAARDDRVGVGRTWTRVRVDNRAHQKFTLERMMSAVRPATSIPEAPIPVWWSTASPSVSIPIS